ncbi:hypothetical protein ACFW6V_24625 [Streptomyces sp. NPDC058734]|uniref:hypothetical protein n=1 Tax=Streptomyces sp. NPDC058734 TaxID=3346615 RepID=UPI00368CDD35
MAHLAGEVGVDRVMHAPIPLWANLALATYAIPLLLLAVHAPVPLITAGYGVAQAALGFLNPAWDTALQENVPADRLAPRARHRRSVA